MDDARKCAPPSSVSCPAKDKIKLLIRTVGISRAKVNIAYKAQSARSCDFSQLEELTVNANQIESDCVFSGSIAR